MKIKIQEKMQSKVKNGGMHLLNTFVPVLVETEIDLDKKVLDSDQFKTWFEVVDQVEDEKPAKRLRLRKDK